LNTQTRPYLTIIVPVKDEEDNILSLGKEINQALKDVPYSWECIWINDGSRDHTQQRLTQLSTNYPQHRFLELAQNFGQSAAMAVGFKQAKGEILATLDGDGQNDPQDIPKLVQFMQEKQADVVNGYRAIRQDSWIRKIASKIANKFRNLVTGDKIRDVGCSIRVIKKECVQNVFVFKGMHRFLPTLIKMQGYTKIYELPVNHRPRTKGKTKYTINNRLWVGLFDTFGVLWMRKRIVNPKVKEK